MKTLLRGLLTIWLFILLVIFGITTNVKSILIDTTDNVIKKEIKENIVTIVEEFNEEIPKDVIDKIEKQIDDNKELKKIMDTYYDKMLNSFTKDESIQIDVTEELETLIDSSEDILKQYDIVITEEVKQELLTIVSSSEINQIVNDSISEIKTNMSDDVRMVMDIYVFVTSLTLKIIMIGLILLTIVLIALLKKSYFKWLSNFGISSMLAGILLAIIVPSLITYLLVDIMEESNIVINLISFNIYGYILIGLGLFSMILNVVISKTMKNENDI